MGDDSKKHHYVPQSILRRFSSDAAQAQVYVFDKASGRSFRSSIRDTGCENHFNAVELEGRTVSFEGLFQTNDDQLARLLECITSSRSLAVLGPQDRLALSEVIAAQIVRTKMVRTTIRSIAEQFSGSLSEAGFDPGEVEGFSIPTDQEVRRSALAFLLDLDGLIGALQAKRPILIHTLDSRPFWISDNPVVFHNTFPYGERALSSPGIEIYFPISSELVLGLFCPSIEQKIGELLALGHPQLDREKYAQIYRGLQRGDPVSLGPRRFRFSTLCRSSTPRALCMGQTMILSTHARSSSANPKRDMCRLQCLSAPWAKDHHDDRGCLPACGSSSTGREAIT